MEPLLYSILFAAIAAALGLAAGWWIRGSRPAPPGREPSVKRPGSTVPRRQTVDPTQEPLAGDERELLGVARALMSRLHQFTERVATDVGNHSTRVEEINRELSSAADGDSVIAIVAKLVDANESMQARLNEAENQLQHQAIEIETHLRESRTDALTGAPNRRAFDDELRRAVEGFRDGRTPCCVMLVDIDHFKRINDAHGHPAGDAVLHGVAERMQRKIAERGTVCRYGGEEFAVVFPGAEIARVMDSAESVRAAIGDEPFHFEGQPLHVTASAGLGQLREGELPERLIRRADRALYASKEGGRNCGHWHDGETSHPMRLPADHTAHPGYIDQCHAPSKPGEFEMVPDRREQIGGIAEEQAFQEDVERRMAELKRRASTLSVLLVEVNGYDQIVDTYGLKAGELVQRAAAQFLKATMRDMDYIARYKDQAFSLMLPGAAIDEAVSIAERLRSAVEKCKLPINGEHVGFTVSVGAAEATEDDDRASILERAATSLAAANQSGGNVCCAATDGDIRAISSAQ